ncbi:MAG TPA: amidohydrolase family protein [Acidimicrobiales bacterium]|nr:amidohydrolase family protein [Acidimicrobiales bacterium]
MTEIDQRSRSVYRLISADSHPNEPPTLWLDRVPKKFQERAPRIERFEQGDAWVLEGVKDPINFGQNACAGLPASQMTPWCRFEDLRRGGWDPAVRLDEMDADGVDAEVIYPTPRLNWSIVANQDAEFHVALVQAYNDWLSEYCGHAPARLGGQAILPNRGAEAAMAEIQRVADRPGIRGFVMGSYPNGSLELEQEDDKVWATLAEAGIPISIHVSMTQEMPSSHKSPLPGYGRFFDAPNRIVQMIFAGVFQRFPKLSLVIAEVDCGWVPYFKEQIDNNYGRLREVSDFGLTDRPSSYVEEHVSFTYMTDTFAVRHRDEVGVDRMLWSSDYPHISADWPNSWKTIQASFSGVEPSDRHAILAGNAAKLYGFVG